MNLPYLSLAVLGLGLLTLVAGTIFLAIAAFRQGVGWGLAVLLLPAGAVVFACRHWVEARLGMGIYALGLAIFFGCAATIPGAANYANEWKNALTPHPPPPTPDLAAQIAQHRDRLEALQAAFSVDGAEMHQIYATLDAQQRALKPGDTAGAAKFNEAAAAYRVRNDKRRATQQEIATAQQELDALIDAKAREDASGPKVVIYTTSHCPACRAAKDYLAQKGVRYREIDVEASREGAEAFQKLGGHGVPLILVGENRMDGFSSQALDMALAQR